MTKGLKWLKSGALGALAGIAAHQLIALSISYAWHFGYYVPCIASLPENVGGELNAVLVQLIACALLGVLGGVACRGIGRLLARPRG